LSNYIIIFGDIDRRMVELDVGENGAPQGDNLRLYCHDACPGKTESIKFAPEIVKRSSGWRLYHRLRAPS